MPTTLPARRVFRAPIAAVVTVVLLGAVHFATPAVAQFREPDPAAVKAFADLVRTYRAYPNLRCSSTLTVRAGDASAEGAGEPVTAELIVGRVDNERRAVVRFRGFTCWVGDGYLAAIHESNPHAYYRSSDAGSAYYALMSAFLELPFPELALALGEESPEDVVMQLHSKAPWLRPTGVERIGGDAPATATLRINLTSDHESAQLDLDPLTQLPRSMDVSITGGALVPAGSSLRFLHEFTHEIPAEAIDPAVLRFDPGLRQRTDTVAALPRRAAAPAGGGGGGAVAEVHHELVGKPAPPIVIPLLDGGDFDLGARQGRVLVLDFWATWCGPCVAAMPHLQSIAADFRAEQAPVEFITINTFERVDAAQREESVRRFWQSREFTLPVALDMDNSVARNYAVAALPTTVVIRADGVVHAVHTGFRRDQLLADIAAARAALEQPVE